MRAAFSIPAGVTYLNCASMAPQLRAVRAAGEAAVADAAVIGIPHPTLGE
ncbi:MAG: hypothetical protein H0U26_03235, partial [Acidimicrobiia bacterium]|nr:hypothetical protein [Acidimicrobiia bacterium]